MNNKKFGAFSSSENSQEFSKTWASFLKILGLLAGISAAIPTLNAYIDPGEAKEVIEALTIAGGAIATIYQSGELVYGIVRKIIAKFNS